MEVIGQPHALANLNPEKNPGTYWVGGWVGPSPGLVVLENEKFLAPTETQIPGRPARNLPPHYTEGAIPATRNLYGRRKKYNFLAVE
jgi:hypothetical protein